MKREWFARLLVIFFVAAAALLPWLVIRWQESQGNVVEIHARMPENGGWTPETIYAVVGEPLHLRISADDVVHGFAVGLSGEPGIDLIPGEVVETTLTFDRPGRYTYYCTRWCGANHWRMRGVIEVTGPGEPIGESQPPLFVELGLDIDSPHPAEVTPQFMPSAERGSSLADELPDYALLPETYKASSPHQLWQRLRGEPGFSARSDAELWDAVAYIWAANTSPADLERGAQLYAQNCAACHGQTGQGDGVMLREVPALNGETQSGMETMSHAEAPDFSDPAVINGASPALLEGKILRGGMGTGMPSWGPIFRQDEIDAIVAFLYTLQQQPTP